MFHSEKASWRGSSEEKALARVGVYVLMSSCLVYFRNKCGIWGWRSEKMETVSGYEAKVGDSGGGRGRRQGPGTPLLLPSYPCGERDRVACGFWKPCAAMGTQWGLSTQPLLNT